MEQGREVLEREGKLIALHAVNARTTFQSGLLFFEFPDARENDASIDVGILRRVIVVRRAAVALFAHAE